MIYRVECEKKKGVLLVADEGILLCSKVTTQKMEGGGEIVISFV